MRVAAPGQTTCQPQPRMRPTQECSFKHQAGTKECWKAYAYYSDSAAMLPFTAGPDRSVVASARRLHSAKYRSGATTLKNGNSAVTTTKVRRARMADILAMVEMGHTMHQESAYAFLPYDRAKAAQLAYSCIRYQETHCAAVVEADGRPVGMIAGYLTEYYFCSEKLACDWLLFVELEYRGGMAAVRLIRYFQVWAAEHGAREVCLSVSTNVAAESTGRLYEKLGYIRVGGNYKLRL